MNLHRNYFLFSLLARTSHAMTVKLFGESNNTLRHVAIQFGVCSHPRKKYSPENMTPSKVWHNTCDIKLNTAKNRSVGWIWVGIIFCSVSYREQCMLWPSNFLESQSTPPAMSRNNLESVVILGKNIHQHTWPFLKFEIIRVMSG